MNKNLFTIDDSERTRILEMHQNATKKQYLNEQQAEQFVYSNNKNPEDREQDTATEYQKYLGRDSSNLEDLVGKEAIVYKSNSMFKENEAYRFKIGAVEQKNNHILLYSEAQTPGLKGVGNVKAGHITGYIGGNLLYRKTHESSSEKVYNEILGSKLKEILVNNPNVKTTKT